MSESNPIGSFPSKIGEVKRLQQDRQNAQQNFLDFAAKIYTDSSASIPSVISIKELYNNKKPEILDRLKDNELNNILSISRLNPEDIKNFVETKYNSLLQEDKEKLYKFLSKAKTTADRSINFRAMGSYSKDNARQELSKIQSSDLTYTKNGQTKELKGAARTIKEASLMRKQEYGEARPKYSEILLKEIQTQAEQMEVVNKQQVLEAIETDSSHAKEKLWQGLKNRFTTFVNRHPKISEINNNIKIGLKKAFSNQETNDNKPKTLTTTPKISRRDFLKATGLLTASVVVAGSPKGVIEILNNLQNQSDEIQVNNINTYDPVANGLADEAPTETPMVQNTIEPKQPYVKALEINQNTNVDKNTNPESIIKNDNAELEEPIKQHEIELSQPVVPEVSKSELLKKVLEDIHKMRNERLKNDPEYANRVDLELNKNRINVVLTGVDIPENTGWKEEGKDQVSRSDAIIVVSYDTITGKIQMLRIPRDTHAPEINEYPLFQKKYPELSNYHYRINAMSVFGEWEDMQKTIEDATGLSVDSMFIWNFQGFKDVIDAAGGVDLTLNQSYIDNYKSVISFLEDLTPTGQDANGNNYYLHHFTGEQALQIAMQRKPTTDYDRGDMQVEIFKAAVLSFVKKIEEKDISGVFNLITEIINNPNFKTSGELIKLLDLDLLSKALSPKNRELFNFIFEKFNIPWTGEDGILKTVGKSGQLYVDGNHTTSDPLIYWQPLRKIIAAQIK